MIESATPHPLNRLGVDMGFALVKINDGAKCFQDFRFYRWPPSQYQGGSKLAGVPDSAVFVGEKRVSKGRAEWSCEAFGAGIIGQGNGCYGNGKIIVTGENCVEMLTPILGYKPEMPSQGESRE